MVLVDIVQVVQVFVVLFMYIFVGVGDMMLGINYFFVFYLFFQGGVMMLVYVEDLFRDVDVIFGNLEGIILDEGGMAKCCNNLKVCYVFCFLESYVEYF